MSFARKMDREIATLSRRQLVAAGVATGAGIAAMSAATRAQAEQATQSSWRDFPAPVDIASIETVYEADVVIVGAGVAGNAAAEGAASEGASVILVEQSGDLTAHGCDNGCVGSAFQNEMGIEFDRDEIFKLLFRWSQQQANPKLIRTWIDRSGEVFDHYCELAGKIGLGLMSAYSNTSKADWEDNDEWFREYRTAMSFGSPEEGIIIDVEQFKFLEYHLVEMLADEARAHGAQYCFNTHAEQLALDEQGGVAGVVCTDAEGNTVLFKASRGVVLATGDISGNQEMMAEFCPLALRADSVAYFPVRGNLGEGVKMGVQAGAAVSRSTAAHMVHPIGNGPLNCLDMSWLAVNREGERFCAEVPFEPYVTNARMVQPGNVGWNIYDGRFKERVMQQEPNTGEALLAGIDEKIETALGTEQLYTADTLDDLAAQLGIPGEALKATVARYNEMCESGIDADFGVPERFLAAVEEPPFYAVPMPAQTLSVPFGLHVDANSQVCTEDDEPIPSLFAVGNVQGDFFGVSYPVFCPGISHGRALTFGTLVGRALAHGELING